MSFVHLNLHSEYSLLESSIKLSDLPEILKSRNMTACALTDSAVMYGSLEFYLNMKKAGLSPIIGACLFHCSKGRFYRERDIENYASELTVLACSSAGLKNLNYLVSLASLEGFYKKPFIDDELLTKYHEGLIFLIGTSNSDIGNFLLHGDYQRAKERLAFYQKLVNSGKKNKNFEANTDSKIIDANEISDISITCSFGNPYTSNLFLDLRDHKYDFEQKLNQNLLTLAKEFDIPCVATNACYYVNREDGRSQEILKCIKNSCSLEAYKSSLSGVESYEFYIKDELEMRASFSYCPQAVDNTVIIADRCSDVQFELNSLHLPHYQLPSAYTSSKIYLENMARAGLQKRLSEMAENDRQSLVFKDYEDRINYELAVIDQMGYNDYFLIVADFVSYAKKNKIYVGPGRGSGAGSLVAYCLRITDLDPLKYDLIFERFLNVDRISLPDFDIDFCYERRQEVIDYIYQKYGNDKVCQVITFGTLAAKACFRDVARVLQFPLHETNAVCKLIPNELKITLDEALQKNPDLYKLYSSREDIREVYDMARNLEGLPRNCSTHAAGVIICGQKIMDIAPLTKNDDVVVVQYSKNYIEKVGLLKFDILALRTLTVIRDSLDLIHKDCGIEINPDNIKLNDQNVYQMISKGQTQGVFQLESKGMIKFMQELKPHVLEDIIAGLALYRPGPMEQIPNYLSARHGKTEISYLHSSLEPILKVTYGCMVYQEQVMRIVRDLAGFSMEQSDIVRRAMSKKDADILARYEDIFINGGVDDKGQPVPGCKAGGIEKETAAKIFSQVLSFASYAFNKPHAAVYAYLSYKTAWLKYHYPLQFMTAILNSFLGNLAQAAQYIEACRLMQIEILPPDINKSNLQFCTEKCPDGQMAIRYALGGIKNVGFSVINDLLNDRKNKGEFNSFGHFLYRIREYNINRKMIESLIKAGTFDIFGIERNRLLSFLYTYHTQTFSYHKNFPGQISLLDFPANFDGKISLEALSNFQEPQYPTLPPLSSKEIRDMEEEMLGVFISQGPLSSYKLSRNLGNIKVAHLKAVEENIGDLDSFSLILVKHIKLISTKKDELMAFLRCTDGSYSFEITVFPDTYKEYKSYLQVERILFCQVRLHIGKDQKLTIIAEKFMTVYTDSYLNRAKQDLNYSFSNKISHTRDFQHDIKDSLRNNICQAVILGVKTALPKESLQELMKILKSFNGSTPVYIDVEHKPDLQLLDSNYWLDISESLLKCLKQYCINHDGLASFKFI